MTTHKQVTIAEENLNLFRSSLFRTLDQNQTLSQKGFAGDSLQA